MCKNRSYSILTTTTRALYAIVMLIRNMLTTIDRRRIYPDELATFERARNNSRSSSHFPSTSRQFLLFLVQDSQVLHRVSCASCEKENRPNSHYTPSPFSPSPTNSTPKRWDSSTPRRKKGKKISKQLHHPQDNMWRRKKKKKEETYNVNARLITCTRLSNPSGRGLVGTREGFGIASSTGNRCAFHDGGSDGLRVGGAMLCLGVDHDGGRSGEEGEDG